MVLSLCSDEPKTRSYHCRSPLWQFAVLCPQPSCSIPWAPSWLQASIRTIGFCRAVGCCFFFWDFDFVGPRIHPRRHGLCRKFCLPHAGVELVPRADNLCDASSGAATRPSNARALRLQAECLPHVGGKQSAGFPGQGGDATCSFGHVPREKAGIANAASHRGRC